MAKHYRGLRRAKPGDIQMYSIALFEWAESIVTAVALTLFVLLFIIHNNTVIGTSMVPTLIENDKLIVSGLFYTPKSGDIVTICKRSFREQPIVKRVIAVGGQEIDIDFDAHKVYIDGVEIDEPYINEPTSRFYDVAFPLYVPEGYVFVMGDNRNVSDDSRDSGLGLVDVSYIQGKVLFRYAPFSSFGAVD